MNRFDPCGINPENVIRLLEQRRLEGYRPGRDDDGNRLGLVVEGGAMRGVISSATLAALDQLGYADCFDCVYGTSSGALNAAYFVSGQITLGTTVYYENATDRRFLNLMRWPDPLDIHWLIDNWITKGKALDEAALHNSGTRLFVSKTDIHTGDLAWYDAHTDDPARLIPAIRASCCTPMLVTHKEQIGPRLYNDGMLRAGIPLFHALEEMNCTHVVAALTRPHGFRKQENTKWIRQFENMRLRGYSRDYRDTYHRRIVFYNDALEALYTRNRHNADTLILAPLPGDFTIEAPETRPGNLIRAAREAAEQTARIMGKPASSVFLYGCRENA